MSAETIVFAKAHIKGVEHKLSNANVTSKIKFIADFSSEVAKQLDARWLLFDREQFPKEGFKAVEMDTEIKSFRLRHVVKGMENKPLDLQSELANKFKVVKSGGKKKGKAVLRVQFVVEHSGNPFGLLEYLLAIGGGDGVLEITPTQTELFADDKKAAAKKAEPKQEEIPAVSTVQ